MSDRRDEFPTHSIDISRMVSAVRMCQTNKRDFSPSVLDFGNEREGWRWFDSTLCYNGTHH